MKALFILDMLKFKNFLKYIIKNPKKIFIYLFQFMWYMFILIPVIVKRGKTFSEINGIKLTYLNAGMTGLMFLGVVASLYSSLKQPGIVLREGDIGFLLSSPIKERIVFLWYMIRAIFKGLILAVLYVFYLPFLSVTMEVSKHFQNLIFGYLGIFTFFLALAPLSFLIYSISMKFNAKNVIKYFLNGVLVLIVGFAVYFAYKEQSLYGLVDYFTLKIWDYVPIIGPSKQMILSYFTGDATHNIEFIILQIATIAFLVLIGVYFARDYYEEVTTYNETLRRIKERAKKGDYYGGVEGKAKKGKKRRRVEVNFVPKGPWAYVWLKMVENKRQMGSIYFNFYNLLLLAISIAFGYFLPKDDHTIIFALAFVYAYMAWLLSMVSTIYVELNKMYIYIIPGKGIQKLIAVNSVPLLKTFITAILLIVPASIFMKPGLLNIIAAILFIIGFSTLQSFSSVFLQVFLPSKEDLKVAMPFFKLFGVLFVLIPVGAVAIPLGMVTKSMGIGVLSSSIMMFLESGVFLLFANFIFERLELK
ncbi:putative ABC exporter domain-containing protein [Caldanaerobius polysaccharolyticus]|uniref:putative ABC exporter domain-containing protein n=1 Tax=Caldanaerobius polysaccharolyticus TaxID=44256 RepID=UPI001FE1A02F|nr:putative ABC exporter domain-containing protein [Caldanaerobius polysaccharolyticus]